MPAPRKTTTSKQQARWRTIGGGLIWAAAWWATVAPWSLPMGWIGAALAGALALRLALIGQWWPLLLAASLCGLVIDGAVAQLGWVEYAGAPIDGGPGWWVLPLWWWLAFGLAVPMARLGLLSCWLVLLTSIAPAYFAGQAFGLLTLHQPLLASLGLTVGYAAAIGFLIWLRNQFLMHQQSSPWPPTVTGQRQPTTDTITRGAL